MCVADSRTETEGIAQAVSIDYKDLGVVSDMFEGFKPGASLLHGH
jgi:hypothetical protein